MIFILFYFICCVAQGAELFCPALCPCVQTCRAPFQLSLALLPGIP